MSNSDPPLGLGCSEGLGPTVPKRATLGSTIICGVRNPYPHTIAMKLETPASVAYANKLLARKKSGWRLVSLAAGAALLASCSGMTQPEDIAVAEEFCAKRGGFTHVAQYERGRNLLISCKDGTSLDVRLPDGA